MRTGGESHERKTKRFDDFSLCEAAEKIQEQRDMNTRRKNTGFRPIARLLKASVIAALFAASAFGYDVGDFSYSYIMSTKEATLTGYSGSSSHITIPSSFTVPETYFDEQGTHTRDTTMLVTKIGSSAFADRAFIISVSFHDQLMRICNSAFEGCTGLQGHLDLANVSVLEGSVFKDCTGITSVETPESLESIGQNVFEGCTNLQEAIINGNGDLALSYFTFYNCTSLRRCVIGDGVSKIYSSYSVGAYSPFFGCSSLEEVSLGRQISTIPYDLFYSTCKKLRKVEFSAVTNIQSCAFYGCSSLSELSDMTSIQKIDTHAFNGCSSITNIRLGASLSYLGGSAFRDCTGLADVEIIGNGEVVLDYDVFRNCSSLKRCVIGEGVKKIIGDQYQAAFHGCTNASLFVFLGAPPSVSGIGNYSPFWNVKSGAVGTYTAEHAAEWEAVIDSKGYWNGLKMKPSYYTVIYDANNGTGARTTATVEWGEPTPVGDGTFSWEAHYFMGWAFEDVGGSTLCSNDVIPEPQEGNTVTLYGQWATFEPVAADWGAGSITLKATGVSLKEGEEFFLSYCDASAAESDGAQWDYNEDLIEASDETGVSFTDTQFSSRLGGIPAVRYRLQIGKNKDDVRATLYCTTRTRFGLFVGLEKYKPEFKAIAEQNGIVVAELPQCRADAEIAREVMVEHGGGIAPGNAKLLADAKANLESISLRWSELAQNKVATGDVVFFVIATHGSPTGKLVAYDGYYTRDIFQNDIEPFRTGRLTGVKVIAILMNCYSERMTSIEGDIAEEYGSVCTPNIIYVTAAAKNETAKPMGTYSQFGEFLFNQGLLRRQADAQMSLQGMDGTFGMPGIDEKFGDRNGRVDLLECTKYAKAFAVGRSDKSPTSVQFDPAKASIMADTVLVADSSPAMSDRVLSAPETCDVEKVTDGLVVRWNNVVGATHYIVNWVKAGGGFDSHWAFCKGGTWYTTSFTFTFKTADAADAECRKNYIPLENDTDYLFWVVAVNGAGKSMARLSDIIQTSEAKKDVTYTVELFAPGARAQPEPIYVSVNSPIGALPIPKRLGHDFLGWFSVEDDSELTPYTIITGDMKYKARWSDLGIAITSEWLRCYPATFSISDGDIATAAAMTAANGCRTVGECYALGIDPEDPNDDFKITDFKIEDGKPVITLNHTKDGSGNSFEPRIKKLGKAMLSDAEEWREVPEEGDQSMRFFKVEVEMP